MKNWLAGLMFGLLGAVCPVALGDEVVKPECKAYTLFTAVVEAKGPLPYDLAPQRTQAVGEKAKSFPASSDTQDFLSNLKKCYPDFNFKVVVAGSVSMRENETRDAEFAALQPGNVRSSLRIRASFKPEPEIQQMMTQISGEYRSSSPRQDGPEVLSSLSLRSAFLSSGLGIALFGNTGVKDPQLADWDHTLVLMSLSPGGIWDKNPPTGLVAAGDSPK
jgi:hypothetical protein